MSNINRDPTITSPDQDEREYGMLPLRYNSEADTCPICYDSVNSRLRDCAHPICETCLVGLYQRAGYQSPLCPICRACLPTVDIPALEGTAEAEASLHPDDIPDDGPSLVGAMFIFHYMGRNGDTAPQLIDPRHQPRYSNSIWSERGIFESWYGSYHSSSSSSSEEDTERTTFYQPPEQDDQNEISHRNHSSYVANQVLRYNNVSLLSTPHQMMGVRMTAGATEERRSRALFNEMTLRQSIVDDGRFFFRMMASHIRAAEAESSSSPLSEIEIQEMADAISRHCISVDPDIPTRMMAETISETMNDEVETVSEFWINELEELD
jgi:hypothetical protein